MSDILQHVEDGVMTLTFNRVEKKNSITVAMYAALADALEQAADDAAVRVLLLPSASAAQEPALPRPQQPVWRFLRAVATFPKPLLAAVCGPAVGIGTTLLLHCDLVYAGDNAAFALPFVNLGLVPEAASSLLLPQMFGMHRAAEALLMGDPFMAEAALEVGLVNRIVPPTECNAVARQQARKLAAKPLTALMETKRLMKGAQQEAVLARMDAEGDVFERMLQAPAAREAFAAFMQKRKPDFSQC